MKTILIIFQIIFAILMLGSYIIGVVKIIKDKNIDYWLVYYFIGIVFYILSTICWLIGKLIG